jgi:hypothetical protein
MGEELDLVSLFGVCSLIDPRQSFEDWQLLSMMQRVDGRILFDPHRRDSVFDYRFEIAKPWAPQFERAKRQFESLQQDLYGSVQIERNRHDLWSIYLRALDAHDCGAGLTEIGRALWPTEPAERAKKKARDTLDQARAVRGAFLGRP